MQNTVLGLHKDPWHDAGAAAVATNDLGERAVACVAQERLDRIKNSRSFPEAAMLACLRELGLQGPCEVDLVVRDYIYNLDWRADIRRNACRTDVSLKTSTLASSSPFATTCATQRRVSTPRHLSKPPSWLWMDGAQTGKRSRFGQAAAIQSIWWKIAIA